ncbi:hypothetical protein OAO50_08725, partial [Paracoccaceae bacterium]|nr:hypothetical protein [Paracoccaceae bacterium]
MKNLSLKICLAIAALLASVGVGGATSHLAKCPGSPTNETLVSRNWTNCFGKFSVGSSYLYVGEYKNGRHHGLGIEVKKGKVSEG